jgi:hypothetical protein
MNMTKNVLLGIAAGVAAVSIAVLINRRPDAFEYLLESIEDLSRKLEDKFSDFEKYDLNDVIPRGEDKNVSETLGSR